MPARRSRFELREDETTGPEGEPDLEAERALAMTRPRKWRHHRCQARYRGKCAARRCCLISTAADAFDDLAGTAAGLAGLRADAPRAATIRADVLASAEGAGFASSPLLSFGPELALPPD